MPAQAGVRDDFGALLCVVGAAEATTIRDELDLATGDSELLISLRALG
ncbi:MAG: hypothetical protein K9J75_05915 [Cyanobium usitatum Tobar12.5m-G36]|nr:hypothetical protein [Cyanobium usitatum Tobar12.5m-G36]